MEKIELSKKIKNSLQKLELMIGSKENRSKINEEKKKLDLLLEEYYKNMK